MTGGPASGDLQGLFWGTVSGPNGSVNIVGASLAWRENGVTTTGFIPLSDHDALAAFYLGGDPNSTEDDFTFSMMDEAWDPNQPTSPPEACAACAETGFVWCPNQDPVVIAARAALDLCIAAAAAELALESAAIIGALHFAKKGCLAMVEPTAISACLALVIGGGLLTIAIALLRFATNMAECLATYMLAYNAAAAAACAPQ